MATYKKNDLREMDSAAGETTGYIMESEAGEKHRQKKADPGEKETRENSMQSQGRRGCKLHRLNLAISPENFEYVQTLAAQNATSYSKTINDALTKAREYAEKHDDLYLTLRDLRRDKEAKK